MRRITEELDQRGTRWAVVGGLAISVRAEPRTTRDVDVAVDVASDAEAERLVFDLKGAGYELIAAVEQTMEGRLATARLRMAGVGARSPLVDLLFASSGIEPEIVAAAELIEIAPGLHAKVATTAHLIAMKVLARDDRRRPQDWDDLRALFEIASAHDIDEARVALGLIGRRGFNRSRNLVVALEEALRSCRT